MELRFDGAEYSISGTPKEIWEFLALEVITLEDTGDEPEQDPAQDKQDPTQKGPEQAPKQSRKPAQKEVDWAKARALRNAGWSYDKIGDELHISGQTVANHLKKKDMEEDQKDDSTEGYQNNRSNGT